MYGLLSIFTVSNMMMHKQIVPQDEEAVSQLLRVIEIALKENNEPFFSHLNELRNHFLHINAVKMQFPQKNHYHKNGSGSNNSITNKAR